MRYKTLVGYRTDVTQHLIPGIGAHRITKLEPEHIEKLYSKMRAAGLAAGTVHHVHRTLRASLSEAVRRNHVTVNAAMTAKAPRVAEEEIKPLTVEGAQRLLLAASRRPQRHPLGSRTGLGPAARGSPGPAMAGYRSDDGYGEGAPGLAAPHLATRLCWSAPLWPALPQNNALQARVSPPPARLPAAVSARLHRSCPLVSPAQTRRPSFG